MIQETGIVIESRPDGIVVVRCVKSSACKHCEARAACHAGHDQAERLVEARNLIDARVGERVRVAISSEAFLRSSFLVYIVPLVALVFCAAVGNSLAPRLLPGADVELVTAVFGITGMLLAFVGVRLRSRGLEKERYLPRVVGRVDDTDGTPGESGHGH
ncbi:RseC/MucC-like positive regulator of sigma(E) [Geothermobacter ehrlichii]|uniref:RseC/MucC-like positive regulator of sigma(E) n=1 Tax=Geothermobacter ehrlichii TaxID=213224 RepID=A0A5D3WQ87_9BACT|nr:SoxR reducing system RseC family protein [Geothermobacter ehrlichii]TYO99640.1 RseC/MucC-like positive regulator of sigma(E) [Geothermobacter ehrlichii]